MTQNYKEFANPDNQMKTVDDFKRVISSGDLGLNLINISFQLAGFVETTKNMLIDNKKLCDYDTFKNDCPIFIKIAEDNIDNINLLSAFGFSDDEIQLFKEKNPDKAKLMKLINDKFGFDVSKHIQKKDIDLAEKDFLTLVTNNYTKAINSKLNNLMQLSHEDTNRVLNAVNIFLSTSQKLKSMQDEELKEYIVLSLYKDAFEIYIIILKELYAKINKTSKKVSNQIIYDFFKQNHPDLWDDKYNNLRNDFSHHNFKERFKYTSDEVYEKSKHLLIKSLSGIVGRNVFFYDFFNKKARIDERFSSLVEDFMSFVD